jgi:hypothetical protein
MLHFLLAKKKKDTYTPLNTRKKKKREKKEGKNQMLIAGSFGP